MTNWTFYILNKFLALRLRLHHMLGFLCLYFNCDGLETRVANVPPPYAIVICSKSLFLPFAYSYNINFNFLNLAFETFF